MRMLVSRFGSPKEVFSAPANEIARMPRLDLLLAEKIISAGRKLAEFEKPIQRMLEFGIHVLCPDSPEYPVLLKHTDDFPPILYRKGAILTGDRKTVAVVGTRSPSHEGIDAAEKIAEHLAASGMIVISGLALGIDTAAHRGTLRTGGKTIAVPGSGLRMIYPRENHQLADDICVSGSVISECHPSETVSSQRLIQRNRIISGLSLGVILVEPGQGALNTAKRAIKQNRQVFIYDPEDKHIASELPPDSASPIRGTDELDEVMEKLRSAEIREPQMRLL